jgi:hypothetical protein
LEDIWNDRAKQFGFCKGYQLNASLLERSRLDWRVDTGRIDPGTALRLFAVAPLRRIAALAGRVCACQHGSCADSLPGEYAKDYVMARHGNGKITTQGIVDGFCSGNSPNSWRCL